MEFAANYLDDAVSSFRSYKKLAERAIDQVTDEEFFTRIDAEANSIGLIVKHIAGNQRSRWRDFLISDGEKTDRDRDTEFEVIGDTRASLAENWEAGWAMLFAALEGLTAEDLQRTVTIRGERHTIVEAVNRQLTHCAYHIGQITLLAKHFRSTEWKTLSVPRGHSQEFNEYLAEQQKLGIEAANRMESAVEFRKLSEERQALPQFGKVSE